LLGEKILLKLLNDCSVFIFTFEKTATLTSTNHHSKRRIMETMQDIRAALQADFQRVNDFLASLTEEKTNDRPNDKWSIGEEMEHLIRSTQGTGMLFASGEDRLIPNDHENRSFADLAREYDEKLPFAPSSIGRAVGPAEPQDFSVADLQTRFRAAYALVEQQLERWEEEPARAWMVWKHPLLGKVTVFELAAFTLHHTRHHLASLQRKDEA
jgi:DinB superfamily